MNRIKFLFLVFILSMATNANASPMARIVRVADSRTVVVECDGRQTAVTLANVDVPPARQREASQYLETLVGSWVLAENGNVYRSPDALFINDEMRRRFAPVPAELEHHTMTYLGQSAPAASRAQPSPRPATPPRAGARTPPPRSYRPPMRRIRAK